MRPICLFFSPLIVFSVPLVAQDPVATAMRQTTWPDTAEHAASLSWSIFSKQYYSVSNWNASGISIDYLSRWGQSTGLICRDGIPGYSWYHLYLSHDRQFGKVSGMIQLRFSLIRLTGQPALFRLGGNIGLTWSPGNATTMQFILYDFPGLIVPNAPVARGNPSMQFLLFREPERMPGLATGFCLSREHFGPLIAGMRMAITDQLSLTGFMLVVPFGVSFGISWNLKSYTINGWLEGRNGLGVTPLMKISGE